MKYYFAVRQFEGVQTHKDYHHPKYETHYTKRTIHPVIATNFMENIHFKKEKKNPVTGITIMIYKNIIVK
jgi:hypothetical protein